MPTTDDWSTTAASNATVLGIDIGEGCDAANINNAIREVMAELKTKLDAIDTTTGGLSGKQNSDATLTALAALTTANNQLIMATGVDSFAMKSFTSTGQSLAAATDAATALGVLISASSFASSPGYIKFANGFMIAAGSDSVTGSGTSTTITYPTAFASWSVAVGSGGNTSDTQVNEPYVASCSTSSFSVYNKGTATTFFWIAVGK